MPWVQRTGLGAQGLGHAVEPGQPDLGIHVDPHAGERPDPLDAPVRRIGERDLRQPGRHVVGDEVADPARQLRPQPQPRQILSVVLEAQDGNGCEERQRCPATAIADGVDQGLGRGEAAAALAGPAAGRVAALGTRPGDVRVVERPAAVRASMQGHRPHRHGAALHHVPCHASHRPHVGRLLGLDEGVVVDAPTFEGVEDLGAVLPDHPVDVHAPDLGHGGDEVLADIDAGDDEHLLAAGLGGTGGDVGGEVGAGQMPDVQRSVGGGGRDGDDGDARSGLRHRPPP